MSQTRRMASLVLLVGAAIAASAGAAPAQENPYRVVSEAFGELPNGRTYGATSAVYPSPDGMTIWVAERCGQNTCVGRQDLPVVFQFDLDGKLLRSFGAGMFAWPHGMHVDRAGNVWVTDATGIGAELPQGLGHVVYKFSPTGELLLTLGKKGVAGDGPDTFRQPSDVLVAPNGDIFVVDGHGSGGNNRVMKFDSTGRFLKQWGETGEANGQLRDPHALAMDSRGRLFVGDRGNSRIQIFDQEGKHIATWKQFGRPSGLFIDRNDILYSTDSESNARRNPGVKRGIYIGRASDGVVTAFIPDPEPDPDNSGTSGAEGVAVDAYGNVYGAEVGPETVRKYARTSPAQSGQRPSFFITSVGPGNGADLGGLAGADRHCQMLADAAGFTGRTWRAYLSTTDAGEQRADPDVAPADRPVIVIDGVRHIRIRGAPVDRGAFGLDRPLIYIDGVLQTSDESQSVNARDRIGTGPWYNARGVLIAENLADLHGDNLKWNKQTALNEKGEVVNGRGDSPNRHDILTGSQPDGTAFPPGTDTTCSNWTSSGEGSAQVGHFDKVGGGQNPNSWNSAHASRGCSQENLRATGGDGLFYCFAIN